MSKEQAEKAFSEGAVSVTEAMEFLGLGRAEVNRMIRNGTLPSAKIGRRRLIAKKAMREILATAAIDD